MKIESLDNKKIKEILKLKIKKYRDDKKMFIVSTQHLVDESYKSGYLKEIYKLEDYQSNIDVSTIDVSKQVMQKITDLVNCKIIGICQMKEENNILGNHILLLDNVQDPGNIGTIIRSSLGFNVSTIIMGDGSCDIYNEKVIRSSEGAIFNINIIKMNLYDAIEILKSKNIPIYGTDVKDGIDVKDIKENKYALIIGNEGNGLNKDLANLTDKKIYIKTNNNLESLNVAVATSILLYELKK